MKSEILFRMLFATATVVLLLAGTRCTKEYSYEGSQDTTPHTDTTDTTQQPQAGFPVCTHCTGLEEAAPLTWIFKNDAVSFCGAVDTAIVSPERTGFTFFGPSACSSDTGWVMTIYLPVALTKNLTGVTSNRVACYYYDNITPSYIFMSGSDQPFSLTIDQYDHQTGLTTGTFTGMVRTANGALTRLDAGKFSIVLK